MATERALKIVVVGDPTVGKTCMLVTFCNQEFPPAYIPTVFDNRTSKIGVDGVIYSMDLWDTAGSEEYERLRVLSYPNTDIFILCYAVDNPTSFNNIEPKWITELHHYAPNVPILLLGTKLDKRENASRGTKDQVSEGEGKKLSKKIKAVGFMECSALTGEKLVHVFEEAVRAVLTTRHVKRKCTIL